MLMTSARGCGGGGGDGGDSGVSVMAGSVEAGAGLATTRTCGCVCVFPPGRKGVRCWAIFGGYAAMCGGGGGGGAC